MSPHETVPKATSSEAIEFSPFPKVRILDLTPDATYLVVRLCVVWIFMINAWAMLQAAVPLLLKDILGPTGAAHWQGILASVTAVSGLTLGTMSGYCSDKIGRVNILRFWCALFTIGTLGVIHAEHNRSVGGLVVARIGTLTIPNAMLHALTSDFCRGKTLLQVHGFIGASFGLALTFGSVLSAAIGKSQGRGLVFGFAAVSALVGAAIAWTTNSNLIQKVLLLNTISSGEGESGGSSAGAGETQQRSEGKFSANAPPQPTSFVEAMRTIAKDPLLLCTIVAFAIVRAGNVNHFILFVLYTNWKLDWELMDASLALGFIGALAVFWQAFGVKYVVERMDQTQVVTVLLCLLLGYPLMWFGFGLVQTTTQMYFGAIFGSATSIAPAIFTAKITTLAKKSGVAGSSLGLVTLILCVLEIPMSFIFAKLLAFTISAYDPTTFGAGLPYFANAIVFLGALSVVVFADRVLDRNQTRTGWRREEEPLAGSKSLGF